jgi:PadR family transcriptional regulator, regulatory protein PadR
MKSEVLMKMIKAKNEDDSIDNLIEYMPQIIKFGKELLVLSILSNKPMCGYDLIKNIFKETGVLLNQGTIYPILYLLEEADILKAEYGKGNMRTKIYRITPKGREIAQYKIDHFVQAVNHFIELIDLEASNRYIKNDPTLELISDLE